MFGFRKKSALEKFLGPEARRMEAEVVRRLEVDCEKFISTLVTGIVEHMKATLEAAAEGVSRKETQARGAEQRQRSAEALLNSFCVSQCCMLTTPFTTTSALMTTQQQPMSFGEGYCTKPSQPYTVNEGAPRTAH
jgi:hypothetical protein